MAGSVNKVIIVGNLGRDPEVRSFPNGGKVVNLRIATSESWRDKSSGERKERTEWHSVAIFNEALAKIADLPSFEALRSQLLGLFTQNAASFVRLLDAKVKKEQPAAPAA